MGFHRLNLNGNGVLNHRVDCPKYVKRFTARASYEDKKVTKEIKELLSKLEVTLLDHLIYAPSFSGNKGTWVSFSADGIMP